MSLLFDRIVRVSFGLPGVVGVATNGVFVDFSVEKTLESNPNTATIKLYNINESSRALLKEKGALIRLEAGYQNVAEEIFIGDVGFVRSIRVGPDMITEVQSGDGRKNLRDAKVNATLGPGATTKQVVELLTRELQVGVGTIKGLVDEAFQNGVTLSGPVKSVMDRIMKNSDLEWSIQDGNLQALPVNEPSEDTTIVLSKDTGLVGTPAKREPDTKKPTSSGDGIEFTALMRAAIKPGVMVGIRSEEINGFFKIRKANYAGTNRAGPFWVKCEAKEVPGITLPNQTLAVPPVVGGLG